METRGILHVCHFNAYALEVFKSRRRILLSLSLQVKLTAPNTDSLSLGTVLCFYHLIEEGWRLIITLMVSLCETFFAKFDSEVTSVWHCQVAKERTSFVSEQKLDRDIALIQA